MPDWRGNGYRPGRRASRTDTHFLSCPRYQYSFFIFQYQRSRVHRDVASMASPLTSPSQSMVPCVGLPVWAWDRIPAPSIPALYAASPKPHGVHPSERNLPSRKTMVSLLLAFFPFSPDSATNVFPSRKFEGCAVPGDPGGPSAARAVPAGMDAMEKRTSAATEAATGKRSDFIGSILPQKEIYIYESASGCEVSVFRVFPHRIGPRKPWGWFSFAFQFS